MDNDVLRESGLSSNEAEVYLLLLKLQSALASQIAEKSSISRPHIYDTLNKLMGKGLASHVIKNGRKYFKPASPLRLVELVSERQKSLEKILPQLLELHQLKAQKPEVEVFEGKEGIRTVLKEILRDARHLDCMGAPLRIRDYLPIEAEKFARERENKKITARFLCSETFRQARLDECRQLPGAQNSPTTTAIWNDKVAVWFWGETPMVVLMQGKNISAGFRNQFNLLWEQKVKTLFGREGFENSFMDMIETGQAMCGFGGLRNVWFELYPKEYKKLHQERIERKILTKFIVGKKQFNAALYNVPYTKVKIVDQRFVRPTTVWVYGNKVSIWIPADPPIFTTIENKELAESYKTQFNLLWRDK